MTYEAMIKHTPGRFFLIMHNREAILEYKIRSDGKSRKMEIYSVFVPQELRGGDIAGHLARDAFKWAEKNDMKVIPSCPYVKDKFLVDNPGFKKIVISEE